MGPWRRKGRGRGCGRGTLATTNGGRGTVADSNAETCRGGGGDLGAAEANPCCVDGAS